MGLNKNKVLVGISGGVDSAVAAALLLERGFEVIGITITPVKVSDDCFADTRETGCCNYKAITDAKEVCERLGIEHHLVDLSQVFKEKIISNFIDEYMHGKTPNPCALCNPLIKWGEVLQYADKYDCHYYATGHYAKINEDKTSGRYTIVKGDDPLKDQSYFLWGLSQEQLSRTIFPLADIDKRKTRELAKKYDIPVHNKAESQEICFVPGNDYKEFLKENVPDIDTKFNGGQIVLNGERIGIHKGYPFYTVGQRKGLGVSYKKPLYVKSINSETNTVVVATEDDIYTNNLIAGNLNLMKYENIPSGMEFTAKIRYRDKGADCKCELNDDGELVVKFNEARKAITPGQSLVIYEKDELVAGGIIKETF
jgi:tRNA-specific 2-thiouridylase